MEFLLDFGRKVRQTRHEKAMSQDELADRSGLHRTVISDQELGKVDLRLSSVVKLADALGVSVSELTSDLSQPQRVEPEQQP